ncbi:hypothetical protein [uncultured Methanobrevibacter sp.]|uniref:hypothetical protein n=1 Tax=uncultured Methanobrevibacter sp. TaxID=253161 RepID=UPI0025F145A1|nr:hypothetical protein [uncultured Methanobrevibacter sp.]
MENENENFSFLSKFGVNEENDCLTYLQPEPVDGEIDINYTEFNINQFNFSTRNPEDFALELFNHTQSIDNEYISKIFTKNFLFNLAKSDWWILPNLSLEDYKKMSFENSTSQQINQHILENISSNIVELTNSWRSYDNEIQRYMDDAITYYNAEKYGISALMLLIVLNLRLYIFEFDRNTTNIKFRLEKIEKVESFENFKIKSYLSFIEWIINPLYIDNAIKSEGDRNLLKEDDEKYKIAIKMFFVINTLIEIFKIIGEDF